MDVLIRNLLKKLPDILAGLPLKWDEIPEDKREQVIVMALHCVLNGPVGVNKSTTFPIVGGPQKINLVVKTSNSGWKGFCGQVATIVKGIDPDIDCGTKRRLGDYWPLAEVH